MARLVRTYMLLPALLMLFIVFYPFAANLFYTNTEIMDNRPLHEKPVKFTRNYAREFEDYYNDTFAGRKKIISKYVKLQKKLKIDAGQYFYGQDGWIFYDSIKANNGIRWLTTMPRFILTTKNWKKWRRVSTWLMTFTPNAA